MGEISLPPGFRFHPTDEELVGYYLKRKVEGLEIELDVIPVIDFYKFDPWELPEKSFLPKRDLEWFFYCPRDQKYPNGSRTNRATKAGYWKATGKERKIVCQGTSSTITGNCKALVFYLGKAPLWNRTSWIMHEYRLTDDLGQDPPYFKGGFALCRVIKKNEKRKRIGTSSGDVSSQASHLNNEIGYSSLVTSMQNVAPIAELNHVLIETNPSNLCISPDMILDSSKEYTIIQEAVSQYFPRHDSQNQSLEHETISPTLSFSNLESEIEFSDNVSQIGCISPYPIHGNIMDYDENWEVPYEAYHQINSVSHQDPI
ncbi:unnamed protein product [Lathyrus sativus]|nr:unnamed protein product [Lathyrus sativus]